MKLIFAPEAVEDMENIYRVAVFDCRQNPRKLKKDIRKIKR